MEVDLQTLVHFFTDREHLFKTITMVQDRQIDGICDGFVSKKGWYWGRYAKSERQDYLSRRRFVEKQLFEDYARDYGRLKEHVPVYFYLYPGITIEKAVALAKQRTQHEEVEPGILLARIQDLDDITNITFTLNDSCTAYWQKAMEAGVPCRGPQPTGIVLPDHNKVFPFSRLEEIHRRYAGQDMVYEVQVWDNELLERMKYIILAEEKA